MTAPLRLTLLGEATAALGGESLPGLSSRKALALLFYLAVTGKTHARSRLAGLLWPDTPEANARMNLRKELSRLRHVIGPNLKITRDTAAFDRDAAYWLDVEAFEILVQSRSEPAKLAQAVDLYQGDFLEQFHVRHAPLFDEWVLARRAALREQVLQALYELGVIHSHRGELREALVYAKRLVDLEPWREEAQRQLMKLLAMNGRRSEALVQYETCRRILADELGVDPATETTALYEQILAGELEPSEPVAGTFPLPSFLDENAGPDEIHRPPFVAREEEMRRMHECLQGAINGRGQMLFVAGEAGAGKSTLVEAFSRQAEERHPDLLVVMSAGTAHTGAGDPYLPFREILAMFTGDVEGRWAAGLLSRGHALRLWGAVPDALQALVAKGPDLINHFLPGEALMARAGQATGGRADWLGQLKASATREKMDVGEMQRGQFYDQYLAVLQALSAKRPLLILLDDLQWVDTASLNLLFHLGRNLAGARVLIVGAYRPDEVAAGRFSQSSGSRVQHPLQSVLDEFRRQFGDIWLNLDDASRDKSEIFVNALVDTEPNKIGPQFRETLQKHTDGHPLFVVELLRALQEQGGLVHDSDGRWIEDPSLDWCTVPARIEGVIKEHIGRLDGDLRQTLVAASVEGEEFTAQVVAQVQKADVHDIVNQLGLELGKKHHLVGERGSRQVGDRRLYRYRFRHNLFQLYLYNALGQFQRELLHQDVGTVLETFYEGRTEEIAAQLAWHFSKAGDGEKAAKYLLQAGDQARDLYAHDEAIGHYERALTYLRQGRDYELAARTLMKLGLTYHNAFAFRRARQAYDEGFALWQRAGQVNLAADLTQAPHPLRLDFFNFSNLDPATATGSYSKDVIEQLFSGLVEYTPQMEIVPNLAHSWEILDSGCRYIFHLRDDVTWSDGVPVTAGDFVYAWTRVLSPATGSLDANVLYDVKGARSFHHGEMSDTRQLGIQARDDTTLEIKLEEPASYFIHLLAYDATYAVPRHVIEAEGETWTTVEKIVVNGPFKLESWIPGESMVLARNPDSSSRFTGNVEQVRLTLGADPASRLEMYESGDLDILNLYGFPPEKMGQVLQRHAGEYLGQPDMSTRYLAFNMHQPQLADKRVRQALVHAIDREALAHVTLLGSEFPAAGGFVPPGVPGHSPDMGLPYDVDLARQLLVNAGFPGGADLPAIELLAIKGTEPLCEYLQESWWTTLGIEMSWITIGISHLFSMRNTELPDMYLAGWMADYPDPDNFLRVGLQGRFLQSWHNEAYEALINKAKIVLDQKERIAFYKEADRILINEAVVMPLTYGRIRVLVKPWVRSFSSSSARINFWKDIVIEPH